MCEFIHDESGLIIGRAPIGEQRPEVEATDIDLDFPRHDPIAYRVKEAETIIERNHFALAYLGAIR